MVGPPEISEHQLSRVYISVASSKESTASFGIQHNPARQSLWLPTYPSSAVPEALPFLHPQAAHYAAQWEKMMIDREDIAAGIRDTHLVSVPGEDMPDGIAPSENADALLEIFLRHAHPDLAKEITRVLYYDSSPSHDNSSEFAHEIEVFNEYGITRLGEIEEE